MVYIVVGLFAAIGALLRDGIGLITEHWWTGVFPVATLIINLIGCLVLGWFSKHVKKLKTVHPYIKTGISTGLIGSFTTFSTFSVETVKLFDNGNLPIGVVYLVLSYAGGWLMAYLGMKLGDRIMSVRKDAVE
ncbi:MAG: fluoride efflux transporter CrcB [Tuberibacillus sp.]